jgi:large subunit ribosomal protein L25
MSQATINLNLTPREVTGKQVRQLRRDGQVPAVIHDHGKDSVHVQGEYIAMVKVWQQAGKHHPIELKTGDKSYTALIKNADFDPKKHQLRHVVFNAVDKNQAVDAEIPIRPRYAEDNEASPAERNGLIVLSQLDAVQVKAVASKLPDVLEYDAEKLVEIGDHLTVADLVIPEGVEVVTEAEHAIATVYEPSALAAANDAAGGDAEAGDETAVESESGGEETTGEATTPTAEGQPPAENGDKKEA